MVRIQVLLDESLHTRLKDLARKQGRTMSALAREALTRAFGRSGPEEQIRTLRAITGLWRDRTDLGSTDEYLRRLRRGTRRRRALGR